MSKKCLIVASVSSMIGQFNMPNIDLLLSMGYKVTVAANFSFGNTFNNSHAEDLWDVLKDKNVDVYNIKFYRNIFSFKNITAYKQIKKLIANNNYELIHCHSPIGGVVTRLAAKKHRKNGTCVIYTVHGFHFYKGAPILNWLLYYPIEKWLSKYTDALITINHEDYDLAKQKMKAEKIYYIPGIGIDTEKFANPATDLERKRKELKIPSDATVLISIGELSKRKNHQAAIKAVNKIKSNKLYYIICGEGKLESKLRNLCKKFKVENRVLFLGYRSDTVDLLHMSDIFIFPSLQEGLPVALMEAMAAGLPCVASKIRGNTDLIKHNKGGFLCGNEYSSSIEIMMKKQMYMGKYNREFIAQFDISNSMQKMLKIYGVEKNMIPKIIHYCWFGDNPLPPLALKCIESWKKYCPDYEIKEWNESNFDITKNKYMHEAYTAKKWAFVPDYARLDIVYENGGIYLDTDVELLKNLDKLLEHRAFVGFEKKNLVNFGSGFAAEKNFDFIRELRDIYDNINFIKKDGSLNMTSSPYYQTRLMEKKGFSGNNKLQNINGMTIYPTEYFCPKNIKTGSLNITNDTYSIHHYDGSWLTAEQKQEYLIISRYRKKYGNKFGSVLYVIATISTWRKNGINNIVEKIKYRRKRKI
jgi:glycosyltransferase involved in cell wall biosynthesis